MTTSGSARRIRSTAASWLPAWALGVGLGLEVDSVDLGPLGHPGGRVAAVVARVVDGHDGGRLAELLRRPVEPVHGLGAVAVAALQDDVLELPARPPGGGGGDDVGLLVEGQAGQGRRGPEGLAEGEDLGLDLAVLGHVLLGVVLVVAGVGGDVDVVPAADATLVVDPLPERLLALGDGHGQGPERPFGEVRQHPEVDAVPVGVAARAGLGGDADVGLDAALLPAAAGLAALAGGQQQGERGDGDEDPGLAGAGHGASFG
jgi:hypothetical protein